MAFTDNRPIVQGVLFDESGSNVAVTNNALSITGSTKLEDVNDKELRLGSSGKLRTGESHVIFFDPIEEDNFNELIWLSSSAGGMEFNQSNGVLTLNSNGTTTSGAFTLLKTRKRPLNINSSPVSFTARNSVNPTPGFVIEAGIGQVSGSEEPEGAFFRLDKNGNLLGVINTNGVSNSATLIPSGSVPTDWTRGEVEIGIDEANFRLRDRTTNTDIDKILLLPSSAPNFLASSHFEGFLRTLNKTATDGSGSFKLSHVVGERRDITANKTWENQMAQIGRSSVIDPKTFEQSAHYANNTAPTIATLSNTTPSYDTLGGLYLFDAVSGSETDYALFGYQVPGENQLVVKTVQFDAVNVGSKVDNNTGTVLQWAIGVDSVSSSLDVPGTFGPKIIPIGYQVAEPGDRIGDRYEPSPIDWTPDIPVAVDGGRYLHIIVRIPIAVPKGGQQVRGTVAINGYFE